MSTQTLVKPAQLPQVWDKPSLITPEHQPNIINPSRSITPKDEIYLRDYELAAAIISWDMGIYDTAAMMKPSDITNIAITGDTVWYQLSGCRALPLNVEVFHSHRLQIQTQSTEWKESEILQSVGYAGDVVGCQLRTTHKVHPATTTTATLPEWEQAAFLIPPGYRIKDGWFYDSAGGRCNQPPVELSQRQLKILTGIIPVC